MTKNEDETEYVEEAEEIVAGWEDHLDDPSSVSTALLHAIFLMMVALYRQKARVDDRS